MGKIIAIEGIDASGKSTVALEVNRKLNDNGVSSTLVSKRAPISKQGDVNTYISKLQEIIYYDNGDKTPWDFLDCNQWAIQLALWYSVIFKNCIYPQKNTYDVILLDGWVYKLFCRFKLNNNANFELIDALLSYMDTPDKTYLLSVPVDVCWNRRTHFKPTEIAPYNESVKDPYKSFITFQKNIYNGLVEMAKKENWEIIYCNSHPVEVISDEICSSILKLL